MSGGIVVSPERPANAWRERGWQDGDAKRDPRPPEDADAARAYMAGYRAGIRRRQEEE